MSVLRAYTGTPSYLPDGLDNTVAEASIGFAFQGYTTCSVGTNGGLTFQEPFDLRASWDSSEFLVNYSPVEVWQYGHGVFPLWGDWGTAGQAGTIEYGAVAGGFAVTWREIGLDSTLQTTVGDTRRNTFQCVLYPNGCIEFNYDKVEIDVSRFQASQYYLSGYYPSPTVSGGDGRWLYPIVGYSTPANDYRFDANAVTSDTVGEYPTDDILQPAFEGGSTKPPPEQGLSGYCTGGAYSLAEGTNCGVTGRWTFCPSLPPLRNVQRDDLRNNQRTSRQLSIRNNAYL